MCVYEETYNNAIFAKDEATKEIARCRKAIKYFENWKSKIIDCSNVLESMVEQNKAIARQCNEIILNGKPIDEGERHFPNGNGEKFTGKLTVVKKALLRLRDEIDRNLEILNESLENSNRAKKNAVKTLDITPVPPCGNCVECNPPAPVVTTNTETKSNNNENKQTRPAKKRMPYNSAYSSINYDNHI